MKNNTKALQEELQATAQAMLEIRYQIPNVPQASVPAGTSEDDNQEIEKGGELPALHKDALPHWELAKKYDLIDFDLGAKSQGLVFRFTKVKEPVCNVV